MIKLVIFDMAGTAIDEDNVVYKTIQKSFSEHNISITLDIVLEHGAGKEKRQAIIDILQATEGKIPKNTLVDAIHTRFKQLLDQAYEQHPMQVFPSVKKVITELHEKNIKVAFNTGYSSLVARNILHKVAVEEGKDIDLLITSDDVTQGRPAPDMILLACEKLGVTPKESIKIGDSGIDIIEGQNAGVKYSIGVTTGAQNLSQLKASQPDFIFDDMMELLPILESEV